MEPVERYDINIYGYSSPFIALDDEELE